MSDQPNRAGTGPRKEWSMDGRRLLYGWPVAGAWDGPLLFLAKCG